MPKPKLVDFNGVKITSDINYKHLYDLQGKKKKPVEYPKPTPNIAQQALDCLRAINYLKDKQYPGRYIKSIVLYVKLDKQDSQEDANAVIESFLHGITSNYVIRWASMISRDRDVKIAISATIELI